MEAQATDDFPELMAGLRNRDDDAVRELFRRYERFLRAAVRRRLHARLRTTFDSIDFVQDVWTSFIAAPEERYTFENSQALLGFLTRVARNKVIEAVRHGQSQKADVSRHTDLDGAGVDGVANRNPTPSQFAIEAEEWGRLLAQFPAGHRQILFRLREGYNYDDIAEMTGVSLSTVNRIVRRIKSLTNH